MNGYLSSSKSNICLIPARSGSKRIKNKNLQQIGGRSLLQITIELALQTKLFDSVIVVTDSPEYSRISVDIGAISDYLRPAFTASDSSPDIEWVSWAFDKYNLSRSSLSTFCILRPTNPFRSVDYICSAYQILTDSNLKYDSVRGIEPCKQHPYKMWVRNNDGSISPLLTHSINGVPAHSCQYAALPTVFVQNASIDFCRASNLDTFGSISGQSIYGLLSSELDGFDINYPEDLQLARLKDLSA